jgi:serine/threonine protein kinase
VAQVLDIAFKCGQALEHAQRQGLVHRDIKPANILLSEEGRSSWRILAQPCRCAARPRRSPLGGSPSYMSPEQVREGLTHHSDMFSLAVVVYELLTGRRPSMATPTTPPCSASATMCLCRQPAAAALPTELDQWLLRWPSTQQRYLQWEDWCQSLMALSKSLPRQRSQDTESERFARLRALPFLTTSTTSCCGN